MAMAPPSSFRLLLLRLHLLAPPPPPPLLLLLLALALALAPADALAAVRTQHSSVDVHIGVAPGDVAAMEASQLTCDDGIRLTALQINDNFCDCPESGFDEPGTSACPNGRFYCTNKGFKGEYVPSSRVNDGICDCCDGSDEYESSASCPDTCREIAASAVQSLLRIREELQKGVSMQPALLEKAKNMRQEANAKIEEYRAQIANIQESLANLQKIKEEVEAEEERQTKDSQKKTPPEQEDVPESSILSTPPVDTDVGEELESPPETESFPYPQKYAYSGEEASGGSESGETPSADAEKEELQQWSDNVAGDDEAESSDEDQSEESTAASQVRSEISESEGKLRTAQNDLENLEKSFQNDFGKDDVFLPLSDQCFELAVKQYTYELCPFKKASQKDSSISTSLGTFSRWSEDRTSWIFDNGQKCWNGPSRSVQVFFRCSDESKLTAVSEPSTCTYEMHFETPSACSENRMKEVQQEIDALVPPESSATPNTDQLPLIHEEL